MFTTTDKIIGPSRGSAATAKTFAQNKGAARLTDVEAYIDRVYALCTPSDMPDAAIVIAQSVHETTFDGKPWNSYWWKERLNPAGMGITGDATQNNASVVFTAETAARAHVAHLLLYATGRIANGGLTQEDDPRYGAYYAAHGTVAKATTIAGLANTWAVDADYAAKVVRNGEAVFAGSTPAPSPTRKMVPYTFVGLSTPVYLPDDILVEVSIVPATRTNVRSRQAYSAQTFHTWHDTGNSGSTADSEENWLWYSMPSTSTAGYNFAADGVARLIGGKVYRGKVTQLTPLNEVTWAAGTTEGNRTSWHVEQCFGGSNVWTNSLYVNAALHAGLAQARKFDLNKSLVQHNIWYGKNCPGQIRARGIWGDVVGMTKTAYTAAQSAATGGGGDGTGGDTEIPTTYVKPVPVMVDGVRWEGTKDVVVNNVQFFEDPRTVTTIETSVVNLRQYANSQSPQTGEPIKPNMPVDVVGWCVGEKVGTEDRWWITKYSHSRMWVGGTKEKPEDREIPNPEPDTDGTYKIVNGQAYYPANDENEEIEIQAPTAKLYQWASLTSNVVKEVPEGTVLKVAYWCIGEKINDEVVWWVLEDEQGRDPIQYGARVHSIESMERPD